MRAVSNFHRVNDPFAAALMPPPEETEDERAKRVHEQAEAARISREIDESLQEAKKLIEKRKKATKVLLLGRLIPCITSPMFSSHPHKVKPSPARAPPSRVSAHQHTLHYLFFSFSRSPPDHRLSTVLLPFSVQTGESGLEIGHPAQSHQVIIIPHAHAPRPILTTFLGLYEPFFRPFRMTGNLLVL